MSKETNWKGERLRVAVLGCTGSVGQRFVQLLADHPWFEIGALSASERSAGQTYREAVHWMQGDEIPTAAADVTVSSPTPAEVADCPLVFSALGSDIATEIEGDFAAAGRVVISNASSYRMHSRVPLIVPEVNGDHLSLAKHQEFGPGCIITNPNCSTIGLVLPLKPLDDVFGVRRVLVFTMQAVSGAGIPGVSSMQIVDNVIPYIRGEEEKVESEAAKILGFLEDDAIRPHGATVSAHCNRVPVIDGHMLCVSVELASTADEDAIRRAWQDFDPKTRSLPSAPHRPVHVFDAEDAPQPRLHRDVEGGMAASVGRLRSCPILGHKFVTLSHNTLRGAAKGSLLVAELAVAEGHVSGWSATGRAST